MDPQQSTELDPGPRSAPPVGLDRVVIYVPAYNAASTLPQVLERIPAEIRDNVHEVLVIDDKSDDNTHLVAANYGKVQGLNNLQIIRNKENVGYGGSQKIAYRRAIDEGLAVVAMLHGDAQYAPELVGRLLEPVLKGDADMVFGSRITGDPLAGGMPLIRYLGNRFLTTVQNWILGTAISEFHSGYRVYSVDALRKVPYERLSSDYHFDTEMLILFVEHALRIRELSIPTHYGSEKNYVNIWKYGANVLTTTASYAAHRRGIRRSRNWGRILGS